MVTDPSGSSIPGAAVVVTSDTTHRTYNIQSDISGRFALPNLSPDQYDVTISHAGFQTGAYKAVAIQVGQVYNIKAKLKVGEATQTVEVNAGQQILETQSTTIADEVTGKQITTIPIASRNAQDLAIYLPAMQTTGSPRNSQFDGLPPGAVNMTFDGINSQDNLLKSSNGSSFFSTEQPRIDDVQEFSISTAATDASASGEGAVQVAFVSKKGSNQFHGGGWEYLRNDALNANYYFNNLASPSLPRQRLRLNEYGYKLGGYLIKNKLFFFTDLDAWQNPQGQLRSRNILTPQAAAGQYTYKPTAVPGTLPSWVSCNGQSINAGQPTGTCTADLFAMMSAPTGGNGQFTSTEDAVEQKIWSEVGSSTTAPGVSLGAAPSANQQQINFNAEAASHRYYPDIRLDYTINQTNSLEFDYHYAHYFDGPDILNNVDATYPVAPFNTNVGSQISNRNLLALAWRTQITPNISNELRVGGQSAPLWFSAGQTDAIYPTLKTDQGDLLMRPGAPNLVSRNPFANFAPGSRNTALGQLNETLTWLHGNHAMNMGGTFTDVRFIDDNSGEQVATVNMGLNADDPAAAEFNSSNLPGIKSSDLSNAENLYGNLAGHVRSFTSAINVNPNTRQFQPNYNSFDSISQREFSTFFSDNWHVTPNLTFNYGLRWEWEGTPVDNLNMYSMPVGGAAGVYGVSGLNNLFQPGNTPGTTTTFVNDKGQTFYNADKKDFAPSIGLAWTPNVTGGPLATLFGEGGKSVLRAGYSIAYDRPGLSEFTNLAPTNPGITNGQFLNETSVGGVTPGSGQFD
ncbi:MAG: TonB-dependent receptor domain-containing protein, partial [Terriglobales bacterium]